jgi:hypothetical protein
MAVCVGRLREKFLYGMQSSMSHRNKKYRSN